MSATTSQRTRSGGSQGKRHRGLAAHAVSDEPGPLDFVRVQVGVNVGRERRIAHVARAGTDRGR